MTQKEKRLATCMAVYYTLVCVWFATKAIPADAVTVPELVEPPVTMQGLVNLPAPKAEEPTPLTYESPEVIVPPEEDKPVPIEIENVIENCTITYYCCEKWTHICGTGDGITATGTVATPGRTCAVDPSVIPYGSTVIIDYGDGELHSYIAEDAGAWVNQAHVDVCVESHSTALALGKATATVYWTAPEGVVV